MLKQFAILFIVCMPFCVFSQEGDDSLGRYQHLSNKFDSLLNGRVLQQLEFTKPLSLPVGIEKTVGGSKVTIGIDSLAITASDARLSAFTCIRFPGAEEKYIAFQGSNIHFNPNGLSSKGGRLQLISTHRIKISEKITMILPGNESANFVDFDCAGFKRIHLKGYFEFDPTLIVPDTLGAVPDKVIASFEMETSNLNDFMAGVSISPFQVTSLKGFSVSVTNAFVDLSDIANPPGMLLPASILNDLGGDANLWRGFYMKNLTVKLPKDFKKNGSQRIELSATDLFIEKRGVTALFKGKNLLSSEEGKLGNWKFSIDSLMVQLERNTLVGAGLAGTVTLPVSENSSVGYSAAIFQENNDLRYNFLVRTTDTIDANIFSAKISLFPNSAITVSNETGSLVPRALLHGKIGIGSGSMNTSMIAFENLTLSTLAPYVHSGLFSVSSGDSSSNKVGKFPLSITQIGILSPNPSRVSVVVAGGINLSKLGSNNSLSVGAKVRVNADVINESIKFKNVKLDSIGVDINTSSFGIDGYLVFYEDDPVYGKGFNGKANLTVASVIKDLEAQLQFGTMQDGMRYWRAFLKIPLTVPLIGPLKSKYILGGLYHHMTIGNMAELTGMVNADRGMPSLEPIYVPSPDVALGLKVGLGFFIGVDPDATNPLDGGLGLEIAFNTNGGVNYVRFDGNASVLAKPDSKISDAPFSVLCGITYDVPNKTLHGIFRSWLNFSVIRGAGPGNLLGDIVFHVDPQKWYYWAGRPQTPLGVGIFLGDGNKLFDITTYFQVGTQLDDFPGLPPIILAQLGGDPEQYTMRDLNRIQNAKGLLFGAKLQFNFDKSLGIFYLGVNLLGGFDFTIRDYGEFAHCRGSSETLGMNGWYAGGQMYVYLGGKVGLQFKKKRFNIISLALAAMMQTKLPNPFWAQGAVAGSYSILGGLVSGNVHLDFEIGEECEILGQSQLVDASIIADVQPKPGLADVDVFTTPQVSFNMPVNEVFTLMDNNDEMQSYKVVLDEFSVKKNGQSVAGSIVWNAGKDVATFTQSDVLPGESPLVMNTKIHWEQLVGNTWETIKDEHGNVEQEDTLVSFTTGTEPDFIPDNNVAYSYPVKNQFNFLKGESASGYIQLKMGQPNLFTTNDNGNQWALKARFKEGTSEQLSDFTYNTSSKRVSYNFPQLATQKIYAFQLVKMPQQQRDADRNAQSVQQAVAAGGGNVVQVKSKQLTASVTLDAEKELHSFHFRTSQFNTFADKVNGSGTFNSWANITNTNHYVIGGNYNNAPETLDEFDMKGKGEAMKPLVQYEITEDNLWYQNLIYPNIYELYPVHPDVTLERDTAILGLIPKKDIFVQTPSYMNGYKLSQQDVDNNNTQSKTGALQMLYRFSLTSYDDFYLLKTKALNVFTNGLNPNVGGYRLINNTFPGLVTGQNYGIKLKYILPGATQATAQVVKYVPF